MKYNKKGFTLVELLAVIVILALIMGIAAFSMSGVIGNTQVSAFKSSAATFIDGTRKLMLANMDLDVGYYYISESHLEKKINSPWGDYRYYNGSDATIIANMTQKGYAKVTPAPICGTGGTGSFINISKDSNGNYEYAICLYDSEYHFIYANENVINSDSSDQGNYYLEGNSSTVVTLDSGTGHINPSVTP